ncbi:recombinase family protein [Aquipseudomonas campi]|uniref:Recombinase family protein n=1 Tax=Aquipseudomonas campi TaxID=2731681 RepID=A0A6M8FH19_9GAMM|nr:recombinase family protein [Pseudomonas campi]QKE63229.1 recombinase family protein [Pseudomonas campi]
MPTAISYVRFSSKKQEEGDSVRRQRRMAAEWVARNPDYTLSDIRYEDLGLSASKGDHLHGNLGKILEAVESGAIPQGSVIIIESLDRFSRLPAIKTLNMLEKVVEKGVDLITLSDNQRYDRDSINGPQLFMLAGAAMGAYEYSQNLARRVRDSYQGREEAAKNGKGINRRNPFWLTSQGKLKRTEDGAEALEVVVVRDVFASFVSGVGIRELARKHSDHFANPSSVRKLLTNPAAIGHWQRYTLTGVDVENGRKKQLRAPAELIKDVFEFAVDDVLFYQAQKMLKHQSVVTHARVNPLAGLVVCANCGGNFAKRNANAKSVHASMSCYTRGLNKENCSNSKNYPMPVLGAVFFETMRGYIYTSLQKTKLSGYEKERVLLEAQIDENATKRRRLLPLIEDGDDPEVMARYEQLKVEGKELSAQLASLPDDSGEGVVSVAEMYAAINGDPLALAKTLQIGGYRIVCDDQGGMVAGGEQWAFLGYNRKGKTFLVKMPDGTVTTHDSLLASGGGSNHPDAGHELLLDPDGPLEPDDEDAPVFFWAKAIR